MPTEAEAKTKYKALHDELSKSYYAGTSDLTKEEFDLQHGKIWAGMEAELIVEGFMETPVAPEPPRDFEAEIDDLQARVKKLEIKEVNDTT